MGNNPVNNKIKTPLVTIDVYNITPRPVGHYAMRMFYKSFYAYLFLLSLAPLAHAHSPVWDTPEGRKRLFEATVKIFADNYWDSNYINWSTWSDDFKTEALDANSREDFDSAMRRMVSSLGDQHSRWLGELPLTISEGLESSLGLVHSYVPGTGLVIERVLPQSPAQTTGLYRGDVIVGINGQNLRERTSYQVAEILSESLKDSKLSLDVKRKLQRLNIRLEPQELQVNLLKQLPQGQMLNSSTAYLYLPSFTQTDTAQRFHQLLADLQQQGAKELVLDLRDNPGGGLGELGLVMCAFLEGDWVQATHNQALVWTASCQQTSGSLTNTLKDPQGVTINQDRLENSTFFKGPLIVLVSRYNNSAGEIAPLVLQNSAQTVIIGEATSGNVEALQEFTLPDGSVFLVAVANLQGVNHEDFSLGVTPDIESRENLSELGRGFDAPLAEALKVLKELPFTPGKYF
jgi:carboxyl-terminal processing protease